MTKQQLQARFKNTPRDASQVPCAVNLGLNRVQRLSDQGIVRACNNPEENLLQRTGGLKAVVYVLSKSGHPLMPCSSAKARKLIKGGKANVVTKYPFTIMLTFECENQTQPITLGVDPGYAFIGLSSVTCDREVLSAEIKIRTNISTLLLERNRYRKNRRYRLWYRKPKFDNRANARKKGWLPPSIKQKLDTHIRIIDKVCEFLQITKIIVEGSSFDICKIIDPTIKGIDYLQGDLYGYENAKIYLIDREQGKCQLCGKEYTKNNGWRVHHIIACN